MQRVFLHCIVLHCYRAGTHEFFCKPLSVNFFNSSNGCSRNFYMARNFFLRIISTWIAFLRLNKLFNNYFIFICWYSFGAAFLSMLTIVLIFMITRLTLSQFYFLALKFTDNSTFSRFLFVITSFNNCFIFLTLYTIIKKATQWNTCNCEH